MGQDGTANPDVGGVCISQRQYFWGTADPAVPLLKYDPITGTTFVAKPEGSSRTRGSRLIISGVCEGTGEIT